MRKKLLYLLGIFIFTAVIGTAFSFVAGREALGAQKAGALEGEASFEIAASFYPVYVIAENLAEGIAGVRVENVAGNQSGCLHDYQITTRDMKLLTQAEVLLVNGGGMESFLGAVAKNLPGLPVVEAAAGIEMLPEESGHSHDHEEAAGAHSHGEYNAHVWMDPSRYAQQVQSLADGLIRLDPAHRSGYEENRDRYLARISEVADEYAAAFAGMEEEEVIIFHDAFAYLQEYTNVRVVHALELEGENSALSARELAEIVEEIELHGIRYLFVEEQYRQTIADNVAAETGTEVVVLDSLVTGEGGADSWIEGMRANLASLQRCFGERED